MDMPSVLVLRKDRAVYGKSADKMERVRMGKRVYVCLFVLILTGCASVPMGSMWKMYQVGPEGLIQTAPEEVRAAVLSENELLDLSIFDKAKISFVLTRPGNLEHAYKFDLTDATERELDRLEVPLPDQRWRVYVIHPGQLAEFSKMQKEVGAWYRKDRLKGASIEIEVDFGFDRIKEEVFDQLIAEDDAGKSNEREFPFRLDILIKPSDGYFTLIKDRRLVISTNWSTSDLW